MPAPAAAVYVIAIAGGCAAAYAFKEFVYDPHIVPTMQRWQARFSASRARRRQRQGPAVVESKATGDDPTGTGTELQSLGHTRDAGNKAGEGPTKLENTVVQEVDEWRSGVDRSQGGLRHRANPGPSGSALEETNSFLPYTPISPTHIIFDFSNETSPTSSHPSASASAAIRVAGPPSSTGLFSPISSIHPSDSVSLAEQVTPQISPRMQPASLSFTYDAQALSLSPPVIVSPTLPTPSPSSPAISMSEFVVRQSNGLGLEVLSTPTSRPDTPFSSLSLPSRGSTPGSVDIVSPRMQNLAISLSPAYVHNNSLTMSDVDTADFHSAASQTSNRTASEADFLSALGDDDFDTMSASTRSTASSVHGDEFDLGDDVSDVSWASISEPRR